MIHMEGIWTADRGHWEQKKGKCENVIIFKVRFFSKNYKDWLGMEEKYY